MAKGCVKSLRKGVSRISTMVPPRRRLFHCFFSDIEIDSLFRSPLTLYRADSWLGELSAPISDAGNVCLLVEMRRARMRT